MTALKSLSMAFLIALGAAQATGSTPLRLALAAGAGSPDEAAAVARRQTGGRVLGVDWSEGGRGPVYLVKVLMPDGSIRIVTVTAAQGR